LLWGLAVAALLGATTAAASPLHDLTRIDADAWLDGFVPYALSQGDVAGAIVVIVKDGQVLTQRGFGYADTGARKPVDAATTMFRPGSISKLFTWTAVMQLFEQGKIDLDADVNRYLDFKIPPFHGQPVTMRNLMTHTGGFEQSVKGLIHLGGKTSPMGDVLKRWIPHRVFAPGTTPAYSNYGAGLAGYIVQRVSGMPFEEYIERRIFLPLGMTQSTFRQPLPAQFAPFMALGYPRASADAAPYELVEPSGAGAAAISGPDMAKFMIAHLSQGTGLMRQETAELMHTPAYAAVPGANRIALGFWETGINGRSVIGHAGDTFYFHSDMWLFPIEHVGLFISMNSIGTSRALAVDPIRTQLLKEFADRYFPSANADLPSELPTAKEHAKMLVGSYFSSEGSYSNFADAAHFLDQVEIGLDTDDRPLIPSIAHSPGVASRWIEIAPFVWEEQTSHERLGAKAANGKVTVWNTGEPTTVRVRAPWYRDARWLRPLAMISLLIVVLTALSWPAGAIARRRYAVGPTLRGLDAAIFSLACIFCWLTVATIAGWLSILADFIQLVDNDGSSDWRIRSLQIAGAIGFVGLAALALWNVQRTWSGRRGAFARLWGALLLIAALSLLWLMLAFHLISFGPHY
jgi:CubicO group peptidase (beta-lactamase class C family)